jgi:hypothetical protein
MRHFLACLVLSIFAGASASAQDPATVLARILAGKGSITEAELARVEGAAPDARVQTLVSLLQGKGLLTSADVAMVRSSSGNAEAAAVARLEPAVYTAPVAAPAVASAVPPPPDQPAKPSGGPAASPSVTTASGFPLQVYGTILFNSFFDTALFNIQDVPTLTAKQGSDALGDDKSFGATARQSRLGLRYQGGDVLGAKLSGQVEVDFFGGKAALSNGINMDLLRLRIALGRLDWENVSLVAGQDWSVFAPLNPTSLANYAIPAMSSAGNPWIRTPQLRLEVRRKITDTSKLLWQIAATDPDVGDYQTATFLTVRTPGIGERGRLPGFDSRLAWTATSHDHDYSVGFSSHYSHGKNAGTIGPATVQTGVDSWGVASDWSLPFSKYFNLTGEAYIGRALGIFSVAGGESVGAVGTAGQHGVLSRGGWTQAQVNFSREWQFNLVYGIDDPEASELPVGNRNRNQSYMGNLMYKFSPAITLAAEYQRFLTDFRNQLFANERGDQANLAIAYFF